MIEKNKPILYAGLAILAVCIIGIFLCVRPANDSTDRELDRIGEQQQQAVEYIGKSEDGVDKATGGIAQSIENAERLSDGLDDIKTQLGTIEDILADSQRRIGRCQEILGEIKKQRIED